jgi:DNA repair exonuclease SbcCD nuclease subunit
MKIAILGDTHFGARNDSAVFHKHFQRFYQNTFFPYLKENGINHIIQMGDVFDRRKYINFQTLKSAREYFFDPLIDQKITAHFLVGNHDTYYKNTNDVNSPTLLLNEYENIRIVNDPLEVVFADVTFLMVPWIASDNEQRCLEAIKQTRASVVLGHFEIIGFEMQKGMLCDEGLNPDLLAGPEMVLSGHFHHKSTNRNIQYLGTPYEMTWSDYGDEKGFHVYDTDTRELTFVPNPEKMFYKVHYDDSAKSLDEVLVDDFSIYHEKIVKVIVRNKDNPVWFDMFIDKLEKAGVSDLQVVDDHFHLDLEDDQDIIDEAEDTMTILSKYVDQLNMTADRTRLDKLLHSLYDEALRVEE